jgi:molybdenum-dependent DNA-binding transcriptional regulator ModE
VGNLRTAIQSYNSALQERYKLYSEVAGKEADGCVRKGFTERLLRANDEHMNEQEEVARIKLQDLLNQAEAINQQMRP